MRESAVDKMNDAIDGVIALYRAQMGCNPERHEVYEIYRFAMEGRMFADDIEGEALTACGCRKPTDRSVSRKQISTR